MKFLKPGGSWRGRLSGPLIVAIQPFPTPDKLWLVPANYEAYRTPLRKFFGLMFLVQDSARRNIRDIANPRGFDRLMQYLRTTLAAVGGNDDLTLILPDADTAIPDPSQTAPFGRIRRPAAHDAAARHDAILAALGETPGAQVLVVYSDAIGHGNGWLERQLFKGGRNSILVLNGRGRLFEMSAVDSWVMMARRALVQSRIVELSIALVLWPVAGGLALKDALMGMRGDAT